MNIEADQHLVVFSFGYHAAVPGRIERLEQIARSIYTTDPLRQNVYFAESSDGRTDTLSDLQARYYCQPLSFPQRSWFKAYVEAYIFQDKGVEASENTVTINRPRFQQLSSEPTLEGFAAAQTLMIDRLGRSFDLLYAYEGYDRGTLERLTELKTEALKSWEKALSLASKGKIDKATRLVSKASKREAEFHDQRENSIALQMTDLITASKKPVVLLSRFGLAHSDIVDKFAGLLKQNQTSKNVQIVVDFEEGRIIEMFSQKIYRKLIDNPAREIPDELARKLLFDKIVVGALEEQHIPAESTEGLSRFMGEKVNDRTIMKMFKDYHALGTKKALGKLIDLYEASYSEPFRT